MPHRCGMVGLWVAGSRTAGDHIYRSQQIATVQGITVYPVELGQTGPPACPGRSGCGDTSRKRSDRRHAVRPLSVLPRASASIGCLRVRPIARPIHLHGVTTFSIRQVPANGRSAARAGGRSTVCRVDSWKVDGPLPARFFSSSSCGAVLPLAGSAGGRQTTGHSEYNPGFRDRKPWNASRKIGAKRALKPQQV